MEINQESVLSVLVGGGGRLRNSELLSQFKEKLHCGDPAEKKQNREVFKGIINSIAVVKEIEEVKYIVLRKRYLHLLRGGGGGGGEGGGGEQVPEVPPEEKVSEQQQRPPDSPLSSAPPSFIELALQQQKYTDIKLKKSLQFKMPLRSGAGDGQKLRPACSGGTEASAQKRFALPLRMAPVIITPGEHKETDKMKIPSNDQKVHLAAPSSTPGPPASPRVKRRSSVDSVGVSSSPQPRRHCKSVKPADEPKYSDAVPLDGTEHKWMVTSASGHWTQVYGLLLEDVQLADRKDFISGFTALHWAAKCGNYEMLCKIIDLSKESGKDVDVNTKSFAGYTPLHVAAIHGQMYVIGILVNEYGANPHVRDNSGKKAHHYLVDGASDSIREMLGGVKVARSEPQKNPEDIDAHKHTHTISRLFQPQTIGYRKKPKSRSTLSSLQEDVKDDKPENPKPMHRVLSDVFS
ncbi:ankyrin repeat domain-containing protein SOWAHA [Clarias gariepinus]